MKTRILSAALTTVCAAALVACTGTKTIDDTGSGDSADTADTADTGETGDTGDTTDTRDTTDTGDTTDTVDSADTVDTGDTVDTNDTDVNDTSDTSDTDTGDTGDPIVSTFDCSETSVVDAYMLLDITGGFDASGTPRDLLSVHVYGGAVDFAVDEGLPVADDDPYAADVAYWEDSLSMIGWDVNTVDDGSGDRRYLFFPDGAEGTSTFDAFYYYVYGAGGNGQFEFRCVRL